MGIVLLPIYALAALVWIATLIVLARDFIKNQDFSYWGILLGFLLPVLIYLIVLLGIANKPSVHALNLLFTLPFSHVVIPGILGILFLAAASEMKIFRNIGYGLCFTALISPFILFGNDEFTKPDTFIDIRLTH